MGAKFGPTTFVFSALLAIIVIAGIAPLSQPRIPMNHMRAAESSSQLMAAESQYATRFPATGFTCDLRQLAEAGFIDKVLASGSKAGYQYDLYGCNTSIRATGFFFTAVPISQDKTGKLAFCGNQEGVLWFAKGGSRDECFRTRTTWIRSHAWR